jgi:MoaA/NifB/PqqE/SkfB family radical SAM enzyme
MLKGLPNEKNCEWCIKHEKFGSHLTTRWHDTIAWALKLKLKNIEDLKTIKNPTYYEIRPGNKCNVMCRSCTPGFSSLIEEEYKNIDHPYFKDFYERQRRGYDSFDVVDLDTAKTIYVTGGEPTINAEFYAFLRKCIKENKTNFNLRINSNFMKISNPIRELFKYFDDIGFTVSIDGTPKITEYVRWKTVQEQVEKNVYLLKNDGHRIACTSVISIYNVTTIGETLEYLETKFPFFTVQLNYGGHRGDILNCFNHPNKDMVIASLEKARKSKIYYDNERDTKSLLDSLYKHYTSDYKVDYDKLKKFFEYNDILDKSRGSKLGDYIPELEACRKLINT